MKMKSFNYEEMFAQSIGLWTNVNKVDKKKVKN